jgi:hypothetical protein
MSHAASSFKHGGTEGGPTQHFDKNYVLVPLGTTLTVPNLASLN